jgi:hypothetical protein
VFVYQASGREREGEAQKRSQTGVRGREFNYLNNYLDKDACVTREKGREKAQV